MKLKPLGRTDLRVSELCLGTMVFGEQVDEANAFRLLDQAVEAGVNFLDTAEMYPSPTRAETQGRSERIIGRWMSARQNRTEMVVATKITGPSPRFSYIRGGELKFDRENLRVAIDGSLERLRTDYIDLYQLHWPERRTNAFSQREYVHDPDDTFTVLLETLEALAEEMAAGRIRHVGLSNETPWGVHECLRLAEERNLPRIASIQNPYSLARRLFEVGLAEMAIREDCGLLAYSPLVSGVLTGKYLSNPPPSEAILSKYPKFRNWLGPERQRLGKLYSDIAANHDLDPAQMAIAFVLSRPFVTSAIIGATSTAQLAINLRATELSLEHALLADLQAAHDVRPNPVN